MIYIIIFTALSLFTQIQQTRHHSTTSYTRRTLAKGNVILAVLKALRMFFNFYSLHAHKSLMSFQMLIPGV